MKTQTLGQTDVQTTPAYPYLVWDNDGRTHGLDVTYRPEAWAMFFADDVRGGALAILTARETWPQSPCGPNADCQKPEAS
ncbi:MAG: hypothetical protein HZC54_13420 [Verrucomicrobia bacterium]|nr:hypothetical protein [Verrucomicrobiota bacterium]